MTVKELIDELSKHKTDMPVQFIVGLPDFSDSECEFIGVYDTELTIHSKPQRKKFYVTVSLMDKRAEGV